MLHLQTHSATPLTGILNFNGISKNWLISAEMETTPLSFAPPTKYSKITMTPSGSSSAKALGIKQKRNPSLNGQHGNLINQTS